jgi:hypothetical protein
MTEAISRVLESEEVIANVGIFSREHMNQLWRDLPPAMREHFLRLMEQFDLSYRILEDRDKSLVIERVPFDPPAYERLWDAHKETAPRREIKMRFKLDATMPAGIPTWFIARSHRFSLRTHWRHGALLGDDRQAPKHLGLIQAFPHDRYVLLTARGPAPQNFFALMRDGLEITFARFPGLGITRRVPCRGGHSNGAGTPCPHEFDLKQLENALTRMPPVTEIQCPEAFENVPIAQLLYGIDRDTTQRRLEEMLEKYAQTSSLEDLKRMQKLGEKIPESLDDARGSQLAGTMREVYTPQQASGAMLRALKLLLEGKDKQQIWGGLKRILTKEGHHLWLCPHHLAEYKQ